MPYIEKAIKERIRAICELYEGANYVLGDTLPEKYDNKIRRSFQLPADSVLFAYLDTTPIGNWKTGAVICSEGVLFRNHRVMSKDQRFAIDWKMLLQLPDPEPSSGDKLRIGDDLFLFDMLTSSFPVDRFVRLLCDLRDSLLELVHSEPVCDQTDQVQSPCISGGYTARIVDH